jgi:uncharacterized protein (TIGR03435 family)
VSADRLVVTCLGLRQLIQEAYLVHRDGRFNSLGLEEPIEGAPGWIEGERYSIEAKAEAAASRCMMMGRCCKRCWKRDSG